jgi:hypothetical protein
MHPRKKGAPPQMPQREIRFPWVLHELHGEKAAPFDLIILYAVGAVFGVLALIFAWSRVDALAWWKTLPLFLVAADVSGGVVAYGGLGVHCCANARHQWKGFARIPGLAVLNLVQPLDVCDEAHGFFAGTCAPMHGWQQEWDLARGPGQFPPDAHIVLASTVETREEALHRAESFHRLFR